MKTKIVIVSSGILISLLFFMFIYFITPTNYTIGQSVNNYGDDPFDIMEGATTTNPTPIDNSDNNEISAGNTQVTSPNPKQTISNYTGTVSTSTDDNFSGNNKLLTGTSIITKGASVIVSGNTALLTGNTNNNTNNTLSGDINTGSLGMTGNINNSTTITGQINSNTIGLNGNIEISNSNTWTIETGTNIEDSREVISSDTNIIEEEIISTPSEPIQTIIEPEKTVNTQNNNNLTGDVKGISHFNNLGLKHLENKQYDKAIVEFDKALWFDKTDKEALYAYVCYNKARVYFEQAKYEDALHYFQLAIDTNPFINSYSWKNYGMYQIHKGDTLLKLEKYYEAVYAFNKAKNIYPSKTNDRLDQLFKDLISKGNSLINGGKEKEGMDYIDITLKIDRKRGIVEKNKNLIKLAKKYKDSDIDTALVYINKALNIFPNMAEALSLKGELLTKNSGSNKTNIPEIHNTSVTLGEAYKNCNYYDDAMAYYDKVLDQNPNHETALNKKIDLLTLQNNFDKDLYLINEKLTKDPNNITYKLEKANLMFKKGRYEETIFYCNSILSQGDNAQALKLKADAMIKQGECFKKLETELNKLGNLYYNNGNFSSSNYYFYKVLKINPNNTNALGKLK